MTAFWLILCLANILAAVTNIVHGDWGWAAFAIAMTVWTGYEARLWGDEL